jgi:hypothetical protein
MPFTLLFDSVAAIARVWDSGVPLLAQSLLPPQDENQVVTPSARPREIRDSPVRRRRERFIAAQQSAELKLPHDGHVPMQQTNLPLLPKLLFVLFRIL